MTAREKVAIEIFNIGPTKKWDTEKEGFIPMDFEELEIEIQEGILKIADWVIEDRKRICAPLVNYKFKLNAYRQDAWNKTTDVAKAIDNTLTLAGLNERGGDESNL